MAPFVLDGPMDGDAFRAYVSQVLAPELTTGDVVIMDNLPAHKVHGVRQRSSGWAMLLYLPAYSPDFNPIEWPSQSQGVLRAAAARTINDLWEAIRLAIGAFKPSEAKLFRRRRIRRNMIESSSQRAPSARSTSRLATVRRTAIERRRRAPECLSLRQTGHSLQCHGSRAPLRWRES